MTVDERLSRLERENRRLKRLGHLALAAAGVVLLVAQGADKELPELEVKSLVVKDKAGIVRGELSVNAEGYARLLLHDGSKKCGVVLGVKPASHDKADGVALLALRDAAGRNRAALALSGDGSPELRLNDSEGKERVSLAVQSGGFKEKPRLRLQDSLRGAAALIEVPEMEGPAITLLGTAEKKQTPRVRLSTPGYLAGAAVEVLDEHGNVRAALGVTETVNKVTRATTKTAENALTLYDAEGNVLWQVPK